MTHSANADIRASDQAKCGLTRRKSADPIRFIACLLNVPSTPFAAVRLTLGRRSAATCCSGLADPGSRDPFPPPEAAMRKRLLPRFAAAIAW
jgi:hypothetical protein